tara:strand:- start:150 stop:1370 length:1221 start_codon:yes stop_codon:yes gene_type:complete
MKQAEKIFKDNNANAVPFEYKEKFRSGRRNEYLPIKEVNRRSAVSASNAIEDHYNNNVKTLNETYMGDYFTFETRTYEDHEDTLYKTGTDSDGNTVIEEWYNHGLKYASSGSGIWGWGQDYSDEEDWPRLETDANGIKYALFEDKDASHSSTDKSLMYHIDQYTSGNPHNISDTDQMKMVERLNAPSTGSQVTWVLTMKIPQTRADGEANTNTTFLNNPLLGGYRLWGDTTSNSNGKYHGWAIYAKAETSGDDYRPSIEVTWDYRGYTGNRNEDEYYIHTGTDSHSDTTVRDGNDTFVAFIRIDRVNQKFGISFNDVYSEGETFDDSITAGQAGTQHWADYSAGDRVHFNTQENYLSNPMSLQDHKIGWNKRTPEFHFYEMKIYQRNLTEQEQKDVHADIKNKYKL